MIDRPEVEKQSEERERSQTKKFVDARETSRTDLLELLTQSQIGHDVDPSSDPTSNDCILWR